MPQKKNPDIAELARGKSGRLIGNLTGPARHPQGPAPRVQPRPPGGQGAGLRLLRPAGGPAPGVHRHDGDPDGQPRADGGAGPGRFLARHGHRGVAGQAGRAVPGGARGRGRVRQGVRGSTASSSTSSRTSSSRRSRAHLTPEVRTVLNVARPASRSGRGGGAAPSAVAVQLAELKADEQFAKISPHLAPEVRDASSTSPAPWPRATARTAARVRHLRCGGPAAQLAQLRPESKSARPEADPARRPHSSDRAGGAVDVLAVQA